MFLFVSTKEFWTFEDSMASWQLNMTEDLKLCPRIIFYGKVWV